VFVHPYDDEAIVAGQGTVALEMLASARARHAGGAVGGGGLIGGMATAAKALQARHPHHRRADARFPAM
jgi:threonine dehydratase